MKTKSADWKETVDPGNAIAVMVFLLVVTVGLYWAGGETVRLLWRIMEFLGHV